MSPYPKLTPGFWISFVEKRLKIELKIYFGFVRIRSDRSLGLSRINDFQKVFRIGSDWFELVRIQISELFGIILIGSEMNSYPKLSPG